MGKYTKVVAGLQRYLGDEPPEYQEKVDALKQQILKPISEEDRDWLDYDTMVDGFIARTENDLEHTLWTLTRGVACEPGQHPHAAAYATVYGRLKELEDFLSACESKFNILKRAYIQLMDAAYEREDISNLKLAEGGSCRVEIAPRLVVKDREKYRQWCVKNGFETQLALSWQTANADLKERMVQGEDIPDGCEAWSQVKVVYTPDKEI